MVTPGAIASCGEPIVIQSGPRGDLADRSSRMLAALVQQFIERGEPVSSLWLAEHGGFGCSSATVRQVMARLEDRGYVHQPHTSAGRVPTDQGYRVYVDLLLDSRNSTTVEPEIEARLRQAGTVSDVLSNVSHELSRVSHHLSFAMMPAADETLTHIEFVPLDGAKILVVVETDTEVAHKVIELGEAVKASELTQGANYLNAELAGLPLWQVRATIVEQLRHERMLYNELLSRALRLASSTLEGMVPANHVFLEGAGFLLDDVSDDEASVSFDRLRDLLMMIEHKDQLVRLLTEYIDGRGLTVVIGGEHVSPEMKDFSLVMSTYVDGSRTGGVGVIGPRRMRYSHAISAVDQISGAVSRVLFEQGSPRPTSHDRRQQDGGR
jgi:heat-inducible transcriptional repressor